jgi:hypothetical protein
MAFSVPAWTRVLLWTAQTHRGMAHRHRIVVEELVRAFVPRERRDSMTSAVYSAVTWYLPVGGVQAYGLQAWEREAIRSEIFPRTGKILLGAAGGGRELVALCDLGYEVVAFEPSDLVSGAIEYAEKNPRARAVKASYSDLIDAVERDAGPLAPLVRGQTFDGVVLGWGSLSHVVDADERTALLRALRKIAPRAPALASYFCAKHGAERFRDVVRGTLEALGARRLPSGLAFSTEIGFAHAFTPEELEALARSAGYRLVPSEEINADHAFFVPID